MNAAVADYGLAKLCAAGLIAVRLGTDLLYRYDPRPSFVAKGAKALARAYAESPAEVVQAIREYGQGASRNESSPDDEKDDRQH